MRLSRLIPLLPFLPLLLASCGGGGGASPAAPPADPPSAVQLQAADAGALVAYFRERIEQRIAQGITPVPLAVLAPAAAESNAIAGAPLQEAGVDEDDLLKASADLVAALVPPTTAGSSTIPARLLTQRIRPDGSISSAATATLPAGLDVRGLYLPAGGTRVAVLGEVADPALAAAALVLPQREHQRNVDVSLHAVAGEAAAIPLAQLRIQGVLLGSRMVGPVLYVVSTWSPDLGRYQLPAGTPPAQVRQALQGLTAAELLPTVRVGDGPAQPLLSETDCVLQPANAALDLQLTVLTAIDLSSPQLPRRSRCFAGGTQGMYMSASNLWLATSRHLWWEPGLAVLPAWPARSATDIHKFSLSGLDLAYRGSGQVEGHLGWDREKLPYRMSEHAGDLRVVTYTGQTGWSGTTPAGQRGVPSPATLTVLREGPAPATLQVVSTLPNPRRPAPLGHAGEQVYGVRFAGERAYVVTFRQTDPLYVLDLSDPADPRAAGELALPGFSDYLFPLPGGRLLGVGKAATDTGLVQGLKLATFDVRDPAQPALLDSVTLRGRGSGSGLDHSRHGISLLETAGRTRVALPVRVYEPGFPASTGWQGLARFEVDPASGRLARLPDHVAARFDGTPEDSSRALRFNLAHERSLQSAARTWYLSGGELLSWPVP